MNDFITITNDGSIITSQMPPDEIIVEVQLNNGNTCLAWFARDLLAPGDFDFVPVKDGEPDIGADSIADNVIAWRPRGSCVNIEQVRD